jgi:hypothetical protein
MNDSYVWNLKNSRSENIQENRKKNNNFKKIKICILIVNLSDISPTTTTAKNPST